MEATETTELQCNTTSPCFAQEISTCEGISYSDRYDDASAVWVVISAILMFFMKAGFLYVEEAFSKSEPVYRRRVVLAKYIDTFAGTLGFWLIGYSLSGNTDKGILGEDQDFIFWFFRFTFASNTATILGGTLVGSGVQMRVVAVFVQSFLMTSFIHPLLARFFWAAGPRLPLFGSPYRYCNGTYTFHNDHRYHVTAQDDLGSFIFIDFAGSGLVHLCGGMAGLTLALYHKLETNRKLRSRIQCCPFLRREEADTKKEEFVATVQEQGEEKAKPANVKKNVFYRFLEDVYPSGGGQENVESAALGIIILWTTWFAFNGGSTETMTGKANHAAVGRIALTMSLAAASGGLVQAIVSGLVQIYKRDEFYNTNEIANGVLASLVAVTGCCPFVIDPGFSILIGAVTVLVYHLGCMIEFALGIHDGARVFPVHAMGGMWGVICVGLFSKPCLIKELYSGLCFCCSSVLPELSIGYLLGYQLAGGLFIIVWSFVLCAIVFGVLWFFPVKFFLAFLPWACKFKDKDRGEINFQGNLLFTHFGEIGAPQKIDNVHVASVTLVTNAATTTM